MDGGMQSTGRSGWLSVGGGGVKLTPGGREASAGNSVCEALGEDSAGNSRSGSGVDPTRQWKVEVRGLWSDLCFQRIAGQSLPVLFILNQKLRGSVAGSPGSRGGELHWRLWPQTLCLPRKPEQGSIYLLSFCCIFKCVWLL